ncbi:MAG TPA: hypothetical protein VEZ20_11720 [Allosphingosinicella sp.]|jgi:hypothetical protein|nr:hypothetical protein [Allosphingosinicella sp.]
MCECHPDADLLCGYEPALFQRYDLAAEFLRRRRLVKDLLAQRWPRLHRVKDAEIVRELVCVCSIEPLRLNRKQERLMVEDVGLATETGQPCYLYRRFIPFEGDAELWYLSPGPNVDRRASGEVAYLEHITGVLDLSEDSALQILDERAEIVERAIAAQGARIATFNKGLAAFVAREVAKWRRCSHLVRWWERPIARV